MKDDNLKLLSAAICAVFLAYTPVMADTDRDQPAPNDLTLDQAKDVVEDAGYTNVTSAEFDDGKWEVEARDTEGRKVDVTVDASTGKVIKIDR